MAGVKIKPYSPLGAVSLSFCHRAHQSRPTNDGYLVQTFLERTTIYTLFRGHRQTYLPRNSEAVIIAVIQLRQSGNAQIMRERVALRDPFTCLRGPPGARKQSWLGESLLGSQSQTKAVRETPTSFGIPRRTNPSCSLGGGSYLVSKYAQIVGEFE